MLSQDERLLALEDKLAIERLKAAYCHAADGGWDRPSYNVEAMAALFVDECMFDAGIIGSAQGRAELKVLFASFADRHFAFHYVASPSITVSGDEATGRWHLIALMIDREEGQLLLGGIYDDEFVRTPEGWRFKTSKLTIAFLNPRERGWDDPVHQRDYGLQNSSVN